MHKYPFKKGEMVKMLETAIIIMIIFSVVTSIFNGVTAETGAAFLSGASDAVNLALSISAATILWSGLMRVAEKSGITDKIKKLISPVIKVFFKNSKDDKEAVTYISENISANILGLGNAATPAGIKATDRFFKLKDFKSLCYFLIFNTASVSIFPVTVALIRASEGAENPFEITIPVWIVSVVSLISGLLALKILRGKQK